MNYVCNIICNIGISQKYWVRYIFAFIQNVCHIQNSVFNIITNIQKIIAILIHFNIIVKLSVITEAEVLYVEIKYK